MKLRACKNLEVSLSEGNLISYVFIANYFCQLCSKMRELQREGLGDGGEGSILENFKDAPF